MAAGSDRAAREARERARRYQARQEFHDSLVERRRRDNLVAGIVGGVLILAVLGGQIAYSTVGPGAPAPAPSSTPTPTTTPSTGGDLLPTPTTTP